MRLLPFKSVYNFRDFGGYETLSGGELQWGKLFRSGHLVNLSPREHPLFKDLTIGSIIDMRYRAERVKAPNNLPDGFNAQSLAYEDKKIDPNATHAPHEIFMKERLTKPEDGYNYMMRSYKERPKDDGFQRLTRQTINFMAETGEPLLIHCAAGKDRTGTLVAIIQHMLGMSEEAIIEDYMLTSKAVDIDGVISTYLPVMKERYGRDYSHELLRPTFGVTADYIFEAFKTMGNRDEYIKNVLGVSDELRAKIITNYLS